jgi:GNAT superfamily N-acetyltransferase
MPPTLHLTSDPSLHESAFIEDGLHRFNLLHAEPDQHTLLRIFAHNEQDELIGGLLGETFWRWLYVADLWIHEDYRHAGLGTKLMERAEAEAVRRGCRHAYLDTLDFQAPDFYPRLGYTPWGVLEDLPPGHKRIFFKKDL